MTNFFTKTSPLLVASLLMATAGFAQDNIRLQKKSFDQGLEMPMNQTLAAHSYPARKEVRGSWDLQTSASYLLWQPSQEQMDLCLVAPSAATTAAIDGLYLATIESTIKHARFDYKSGFKVGLGANLDYDNWNALCEYTWFHTKSRTNATADAGQVLIPTQGLSEFSDIFSAASLKDGSGFNWFQSASQGWKLKMDFVDLTLGRSFYSGTKLTINPFFGARGGWIRQKVATTYLHTLTATTTDSLTEGFLVASESVSQGVGPRAGVESNFLLGYGLRLTGKAGSDLLFTRYKTGTVTGAGDAFNDGDVGPPTLGALGTIKDKNLTTLRAHTDLQLGLGWGSYFDNNNWYVDLSADYGFQVFYDQNMHRSSSTGNLPNGNLYVHGLTATARLDF